MKKKKFFLILLTSIVLLSFCLIPVFAASTSIEIYYTTAPSDLGTAYGNGGSPTINKNIMTKYYLVITPGFESWQLSIRYNYNDTDDEDYQIGYAIYVNDNGKLVAYRRDTGLINYDYHLILIPEFTIDYDNTKTYYIPYFCYNCSLYTSSYGYLTVYSSTTTDNVSLMNQYYNLGYQTGYDTGYSEGLENGGIALNNLPLVDKLTTFIATFTGDGTAHYITPLAICMILILIYILFIRWVLNLSKSAKLVKLTDIVVLIACICILVVMYVPMLNLTITQHQIVEQIETTSIEETVRLIREPITIVTDETGEIMYGPVGTVRILYESVTEDSIEDITESAISIIETTGG